MLSDTDKPNVEIDNGNCMEVDGPADEANDMEKEVDLEGDEREGEEDEGEEEGEEISQHNEEEPPIPDEEGVDGDDEPVDPEAEVDGEEDQDQDPEAAEAEIEQENENENEDEEVENDEEPSPGGDVEDQEIELQPAHHAEALDVLASIELKFALLRERVCGEDGDFGLGGGYDSSLYVVLTFKFLFHLNLVFDSCSSRNAIFTKGNDKMER